MTVVVLVDRVQDTIIRRVRKSEFSLQLIRIEKLKDHYETTLHRIIRIQQNNTNIRKAPSLQPRFNLAQSSYTNISSIEGH